MRIKEILYPKQNGLVKKNKPFAVVVNSPYDDEGGAVKYEDALNVVDERGFTVLNKPGRPVKFGFDGFRSELSPVTGKATGLTVYLESHGAPGWLFGGWKTPESEIEHAFVFAEYVRSLEQKSGLKVKNIILNSCFSANEYYNQSTQAYFLSPARVLSYLLPECDIVGFIGKNATAGVLAYQKVTDKKKSISYRQATFSLEEAAVSFRNGSIVEGGRIEIYCDHCYTPSFISEACSIDVHNEEYYKPTFGKEIVDALRKRSQYVEKSYGDKQLEWIEAYLQKQETIALAQEEEEISEEPHNESLSLKTSVGGQQVVGFFAVAECKEDAIAPDVVNAPRAAAL